MSIYFIIFIWLLIIPPAGDISKQQAIAACHKQVSKHFHMNNSNNRDFDADNLLDRLNYWVQQGGDPDHSPAGVKSTGESRSKIMDIKNIFEKAGIELKWVNDHYELAAP